MGDSLLFGTVSVFQIAVTLFVLFALSRALLRFKDRKISLGTLLFWAVVWIGALVVLYIPSITMPVARMLNIGRGIDVVVYLSIILVYYLLFRMYVRIEKMEQNITQAVRQSAINTARK